LATFEVNVLLVFSWSHVFTLVITECDGIEDHFGCWIIDLEYF
jgi:hypothetical protein